MASQHGIILQYSFDLQDISYVLWKEIYWTDKYTTSNTVTDCHCCTVTFKYKIANVVHSTKNRFESYCMGNSKVP